MLGAIDGTHITIRAPKENKKDFFSRYQQYDIVCEGLVDGNTKFLDIVAGFPGSMDQDPVLSHDIKPKEKGRKEVMGEIGFLRIMF